jgi:hypothetical protein
LDDVCKAESPFRESPIVKVGEWFGYEGRFEQEFPESVGVAGEVMTGGGGTKTWIDADE